MPFRNFRKRLSSSVSQDSGVSRLSVDEQSWGRRSGSFDERHPPVIPRVKSVRHLGLTGDPRHNRDTGGSVRFGKRTLWIWRDTHQVHDKNGKIQLDTLLSSTASWTDHHEDESPVFEHGVQKPSDRDRSVSPRSLVLRHYGENPTERAYFRIIHDGCEPRAGVHKDGSRRVIWPNTPPLVASTSESGRVIAYAWIQKAHVRGDGSAVTQFPATTLYRLSYIPTKDRDVLPLAKLIDGSFWNENEIPYGAYGTVIRDGIAYLFAQIGSVTTVARVLVDLIERQACYEYWVNCDWTKAKPAVNDPGINVPNANAGGPGTYYWSESWQCFVWIGSSAGPGADCWISTAPSPTGPWIPPFQFYKGVNGTHGLGAQSVQAHPSLLRGGEDGNGMYLTYTKVDMGPQQETVYSTPLVYIEWDDDDSSDM